MHYYCDDNLTQEEKEYSEKLDAIVPAYIANDYSGGTRDSNSYRVNYNNLSEEAFSFIINDGNYKFIDSKYFNYQRILREEFSMKSIYLTLSIIVGIIFIISLSYGVFLIVIPSLWLSPFLYSKYYKLNKAEESFREALNELRVFYYNLKIATENYEWNEFLKLYEQYSQKHERSTNKFLIDLCSHIKIDK
jgi:hypothetical protein